MFSIVVLDCDVTSTFAKVNRIDLLEKLFSDAKLVITASVYNELLKVKQYGFDFPDRIMESNIKLINLKSVEKNNFEEYE